MATTTTKKAGGKNGSAAKKKAAPKKEPVNRIAEDTPVVTKVTIPRLNRKMIGVKLVGLSPLVTHSWDTKTRRQMLEAQTGRQKETSKEKRCPDEEFLRSAYWIEGNIPEPEEDDEGRKYYKEDVLAKTLAAGVYGLPVTGFKNAMVSACRNTGLTMTSMRQTIFVSPQVGDDLDMAIIEDVNVDPNAKEPHPIGPTRDSRIVRVGRKLPMERFRARWDHWAVRLLVEYDANVINGDQIANLIQIAGYYVGVFEGRPDKSALSWGRFEIEMTPEEEAAA